MRGLKEELKIFNINLDDIKETKEFNDNLQEAISKFAEEKVLRKNLQVVLNGNLIELRNNYGRLQTIFGCKISLQELEESISFVLKHCFNNEKSAAEMFEELGYEEKDFNNGITNFIKDFKKETQSNIHLWEDEKTISKNGDIDSVRITMPELKAIYKKCEEKGWI